MTIEEAKKLVCGQELYWNGKTETELEIKRNKERDFKRPLSNNAYRVFYMCCELPNPVTFVRYADDRDSLGFPIIYIITNNNKEERFSSSWFSLTEY